MFHLPGLKSCTVNRGRRPLPVWLNNIAGKAKMVINTASRTLGITGYITGYTIAPLILNTDAIGAFVSSGSLIFNPSEVCSNSS